MGIQKLLSRKYLLTRQHSSFLLDVEKREKTHVPTVTFQQMRRGRGRSGSGCVCQDMLFCLCICVHKLKTNVMENFYLLFSRGSKKMGIPTGGGKEL